MPKFMRLSIVSFLILFALFGKLFGQTVNLAWTAPTNSFPSMVYTVWYGTNSGSYSTNISAGTNLSLTVSNLTQGVMYYFSVTDAWQGLVSPFSNEISYQTDLSTTPVSIVGMSSGGLNMVGVPSGGITIRGQ